MQLFYFISIFVPLAILLVLPKFFKQPTEAKNRWILYVASFLFFISWYLPSPLIDGQNTSFITHLVGGGIFTALLGLYLYRVMQVRFSMLGRFVAIFTLVSSLGVINELFEIVLVRTKLADILITDTSLDLVANTAGAVIAWTFIEAICRDRWN